MLEPLFEEVEEIVGNPRLEERRNRSLEKSENLAERLCRVGDIVLFKTLQEGVLGR